jgi:hypothetical protein
MRWVRTENTNVGRVAGMMQNEMHEKLRRLFEAASVTLPDDEQTGEDLYFAQTQWAVTEAMSAMFAVLTGWSDEDFTDQAMRATERAEEMIHVVAGMMCHWVCETMTAGKSAEEAARIREKVISIRRRVMGEPA